jgi:osmotically-inducible protein OsmY
MTSGPAVEGAAAGRTCDAHRETNRINFEGEEPMKNVRAIALAILTGVALVNTGCSVMRGQTDVGTYIDDKTITAAVKAKMIDAAVINVDTLNGTVALSGFAKSNVEKSQAEAIARSTKGVREVRNNLVVRP